MKDNSFKNEPNVKRKNIFFTKDKICFFVVGFLLGAIIASSAFLIYTNATGNNYSALRLDNGAPPSMSDDGTPPELPDGETPPEMPNSETPPEKLDDTESTDNQTDSNSQDRPTSSRPDKKKQKTSS